MMRQVSILIVALAGAIGSVDGFKFMSNWQPPKILTNEQKVEIAKTEERFGDKKLVVITGCSSGLGRETVKNLLATDKYHVVGAVRDVDKMEAVAELDGFNMDNFKIMELELNSFESVDKFCDNLKDYQLAKPIDRLICNAGVYQPSLDYAKWSVDGHEQTMQINFLFHFLMISKLMPGMSVAPDPRVIMVGSVTGNDNTVGGGGVYPIADLKNLDGFKAGFKNPIAMADGYGFIGAKAYKDSKLCLMMTSNFLYSKYHRNTGIAFSSIYPGCIAETPLFREKRAWFRKYFPIFMKYITGGYVGVDEAGQRLFQVAHDPRCSKSGVYWSWNGGPREGRGAAALEKSGQISGGGGAGGGWDSIYENDQSDKVNNLELSVKLFETATQITGAQWPEAKSFVSPCPTLKVIGAISSNMIAREELKRMAERPGFNEDGTPIKLTKRKKAALIADKVIVRGVLGNTVGRVGRLTGRLLLGRIPETAKQGSFQDEKPLEEAEIVAAVTSSSAPEESSKMEIETTTVVTKSIDVVDEEDKLILEDEIFDQVFANGNKAEEPSAEREWKVADSTESKEKELSTV
jgi:protochlorophyllide reductase